MKTILTLLDFSDASTNALSFAAEISKRTSARLIIINIVQNSGDEEESKNRLKIIESDLRKSFDSDLKCESTIAHGNLISTLKKLIAIQQPDLIVMGTKGASGLKRILIGSNTVNVIANTKVPVLVIPEVARFESFHHRGKNRIVFATDLDEMENDTSLDILKEVALLIREPRLSVLSVRPKDTNLPSLKRKEREFLISFFNAEIKSDRATVFSDSVIGGINFYLNQKNTDAGLIAMIARDSGQFTRHYTREMASLTHLPLLVLHDTKIS